MRALAPTTTQMSPATTSQRALASAPLHLAARRALVARRRRPSGSLMSARASSAAPTAPSSSSSSPSSPAATLATTAVDAPGAAAAAAAAAAASAPADETAAPAKVPWWKKHDPLPNIVAVSSVHDLLEVFAGAGDKLVLIDVYAEWCHACRGISQKVFALARDRPDDLVLAKLDFDANKQLAKALGVRALPSFALFRGADGKLDLFTAGPARAALLREKVERYGAPRCVLSGEIGGGGGGAGSAAAAISPELRELLEKQQREAAAAAAAAGESK